MSNKEQNALIKTIRCPEIEDVKFASGLQAAFDAINANFARLANHDFIKGSTGTSVQLRQIPVYDTVTKKFTNDICESLYNFISDLVPENQQKLEVNNVKLDFFRNFSVDTAGKIPVIYNLGDGYNTQDEPVLMLQYTFLDGRFWNPAVKDVDKSIFLGIEDKSCIITGEITENGFTFTSLSDALPTMYYETNIGLCWKLNGIPTGMPVQGIPGRDGVDATIKIAKVNELSEVNGFEYKSAEVISLFDTFSGDILASDIQYLEDYDESAALIITKDNEVFFGQLELREDNKLYAVCSVNQSLNHIVDANVIMQVFKNMSLIKSTELPSHLRGLFIPINYEDKQAAHMISASSIINSDDSSLYPNADLLITPVNDIDLQDISEGKDEMLVEKYLYLQLDNTSDPVKDLDDESYKNFHDALSKVGNCLKYKLKSIIKNDDYTDNTFLEVRDDRNMFGSYNEKIKSTFEKVDIVEPVEVDLEDVELESTPQTEKTLFIKEFINKIDLNKDNVKYVYKDNISGELKSTKDDKEVIENIFADDSIHQLYVWELCITKDDGIDIDIMKNSELSNYSDLYNVYRFNYIFTTTFTPSVSSEIIWFDGCTSVEFEEKEYIEELGKTYYYIAGFANTTEGSPFKFMKFVPVYKDTAFHLNTDTALNINYNVNISGCGCKDSKSMLTVNGDVISDNLNVYNTANIGKIENIYTNNNIIGDAGLLLSKNEDAYNVQIDSIGNIITNESVIAPVIKGVNIETDKLTAVSETDGEKYENNGVVITNNLEIIQQGESLVSIVTSTSYVSATEQDNSGSTDTETPGDDNTGSGNDDNTGSDLNNPVFPPVQGGDDTGSGSDDNTGSGDDDDNNPTFPPVVDPILPDINDDPIIKTSEEDTVPAVMSMRALSFGSDFNNSNDLLVNDTTRPNDDLNNLPSHISKFENTLNVGAQGGVGGYGGSTTGSLIVDNNSNNSNNFGDQLIDTPLIPSIDGTIGGNIDDSFIIRPPRVPGFNNSSKLDQIIAQSKKKKSVKVDIAINKLRSLNIAKLPLSDDEIKSGVAPSKITSDVPFISTGKSSIIVTDSKPEEVFIDSDDANIVANDYNVVKTELIEHNEGDTIAENKKNEISNDDAYSVTANKLLYAGLIDDFKKKHTFTFTNNNRLTIFGSAISPDLYFNESIFGDNIARSYIFKGIIKRNSEDKEDTKIDTSKPIKIILPKYKFNIGLQAKCINGYWPMLSFGLLYLSYEIEIYKSAGSTPTILNKHDSNTDINDRISSIYKFNKTIWNSGVLEDGSEVAKKNRYNSWRYRTFNLSPYPILISNKDHLTAIAEAYKDGYDVIIKVYPEFNMTFKSEPKKNKNEEARKNVGDLNILSFFPYNYSDKPSDIVNLDSVIFPSNNTQKELYTKTYKDEISKLEYNLIKTSSTENTSQTVICKNGIIFKQGNKVAGLGYNNVNKGFEIFYHTDTDTKQIDLFSLFEKLN